MVRNTFSKLLNVKCEPQKRKTKRNLNLNYYCCGGGAGCIGGANRDINETLLCNTFLIIAGTAGLLAAASVASRSS